MELKFLDSSNENFLCDRYKVLDCDNFNELSDAISKLEKKFPDYQFLATLDDLGQACYTSMHTKMYHDLDNTEDESLEHLPAECFEEDGEHKGYLSCKEEFAIRKRNIEKKLAEVSFSDVCNKGVGLYCDGEKDFDEANRNASSILDSEVYILKVPVEYCYETICAFPNGYFGCDLNPFENIILAKTLYQKFNYHLIALGASHLAFKKNSALSDSVVIELVELMNQVYSDVFDIKLRERFSSYIKNNEFLILSYTE